MARAQYKCKYCGTEYEREKGEPIAMQTLYQGEPINKKEYYAAMSSATSNIGFVALSTSTAFWD